MTAKEYCIAFCEGYFYAQLGEKLTNGKVTEHALDLAKETAQTCIEQQIAYSGFDEKQKKEMKENLPTNNRNLLHKHSSAAHCGQRLR